MNIKKIIKSAFIICFLCLGFGTWASNVIQSIQSNSMENKLQIIINMKEKPDMRTFTLSQPMRLVVDVDGMPGNNFTNNLTFHNRGVSTVRTGLKDDGGVRIVLELVKDFRWKAYVANAANGSGYQIIVEVFDYAGEATVQSARKSTALANTSPFDIGGPVNDTMSLSESQVQTMSLSSSKGDLMSSDSDKSMAADVSIDTTNFRTPSSQSQPTAIIRSKTDFLKFNDTTVVENVKPRENYQPRSDTQYDPSIQYNNTKTQYVNNGRRTDNVMRYDEPVQSKALVSSRTPPDSFFNGKPKRARQKKFLIMIDPGHGGKDSGAVGLARTMEKNVVLQISKRLKQKIDAMRGMRAVLTRSTDRYITLRGRLALARKYKPDLFLSIHADAAHNRSAKGSSIYVLSNRGASSEAAKILAQGQNAVDTKYNMDISGLDNEVGNVMVKMQQDATIESSHRLAKITLRQLKGIGRVHKRLVERASFAVLKSPSIPSMLVETAFISNRQEEQKLRSASYQNKLAHAIAVGVKGYLDSHSTQSEMVTNSL